MIYDYLIVGAGISGLNTGIEILKRNPNLRVLIVERNSYRTGGRVFTDKFKIGKQQYALDAGAGRFSDTHKRLLGLIDRYNLSDKMYRLGKTSKFIKTGKYSNRVKFPDSESIIRAIIKHIDNLSSEKREALKSMTFKELALNYSTKKQQNFLKNHTHAAKYQLQMPSAVKAFKRDLNSRKNFYILFGGLSQITDMMTSEFLKLGGKIVKSFEVISVNRNDNIFTVVSSNETKNNKKRTHNLILTTPKNVLEKIEYLRPLKKQLAALQCKSLYRIYAIYPKNPETGEVWFQKILRTVTDSCIKYIIPINPGDGSIMISYTDANHANYWHKIPDDKLTHELHREVIRVYPEITDIPEPLVVKNTFGNQEPCYYRKGTDPDELRKNMVNPMPNVFVCGDSFSSHQAWMEGALETSEMVIKSIFKK